MEIKFKLDPDFKNLIEMKSVYNKIKVKNEEIKNLENYIKLNRMDGPAVKETEQDINDTEYQKLLLENRFDALKQKSKYTKVSLLFLKNYNTR